MQQDKFFDSYFGVIFNSGGSQYAVQPGHLVPSYSDSELRGLETKMRESLLVGDFTQPICHASNREELMKELYDDTPMRLNWGPKISAESDFVDRKFTNSYTSKAAL